MVAGAWTGDRPGLVSSEQPGGLTVAGPRRPALTGRSAAGGLGLGPCALERPRDPGPGPGTELRAPLLRAGPLDPCFISPQISLVCVRPHISHLFPQTKQLSLYGVEAT